MVNMYTSALYNSQLYSITKMIQIKIEIEVKY